MIHRGATSIILPVFIQDVTKAAGGLTGLAYNSSGLTASYWRDGDTSATTITLVSATLGTYASGGFVERGNGWYELGVPNAALSSGKSVTITLKGATDMADCPNLISIVAVDPQDTDFGIYQLGAAGNLAVLAVRLSAARAGYLDKLNVTGTLANTDNADSFKADVSRLSMFDPTTQFVQLAAAQSEYAPAKAGDVMTLTGAYDAAKGAAGANATATGFATPSDLTTLQTHGDSTWATATGFATPGDVSVSVIGGFGADDRDKLSAIATDYQQRGVAVTLPAEAPDGYGAGDVNGPGSDEVTITWTNSTTNLPVADGDVWITSDSAGTNTVAGTLQTNSQGRATFLLDGGVQYYLWAQKDGVNSIRGAAFTAMAD